LSEYMGAIYVLIVIQSASFHTAEMGFRVALHPSFGSNPDLILTLGLGLVCITLLR